MRFEDDVCMVTGATGGIGEAVAHRLAEEGGRVAVHTATRPDRAEALAKELPGDGHAAFRADLMDPDARGSLVDDVLAHLGSLDVLVNNAGLFEGHPPLDDGTDLATWRDAWRRTLDLNLVAPADLCFLAARAMSDQGGGRIVNVSSRGAFRGEPNAPAYGASKAGLNALTQSLAQALGPHGITVAAVAPGFVDTPMVANTLEARGEAIRGETAIGRVATPEEVAACIAFLASGEAESTTGAIVDVNGASYLRT